eukprot:5470494-Prymnesium_polylepis.3
MRMCKCMCVHMCTPRFADRKAVCVSGSSRSRSPSHPSAQLCLALGRDGVAHAVRGGLLRRGQRNQRENGECRFRHIGGWRARDTSSCTERRARTQLRSTERRTQTQLHWPAVSAGRERARACGS